MATESVRLYVDNDQEVLSWALEQARDIRATSQDCQEVKDGVWTREEAERFHLADVLSDELPEQVGINEEDFSGTLAGQLIENALNEVDWVDLAEHYLGKIDEGA